MKLLKLHRIRNGNEEQRNETTVYVIEASIGLIEGQC